jgi:hypothetical protein
MRKAQIFSMDAVFSMVLFIVIFVFLLSLWNLYSTQLQENVVDEEMQLLAFQITNLLVSTDYYDASSTIQIGVVESDRQVSSSQLSSFLSADYNQVKEALSIVPYEYHFQHFGRNGTLIDSSGVAPYNSTRVISITRFANLNNENAQLSFTLWQ